MRIAVWCDDPILKDGCGSGLAHILVGLLREAGEDAYVLNSVPPHPFAIHVMLELDIDIRGLEIRDEPDTAGKVIALSQDCPWPAVRIEIANPMENFDDSYNDERVHQFRLARETLRSLGSLRSL